MAALDSRYPRSTRSEGSVNADSTPPSGTGSDSEDANATVTNYRGVNRAFPAGNEPAPQQWGHLERLEKIGQGEFGEVYRAWDAQLEREVALKLCRSGCHSEENCIRSGLHEARLLARVSHPSVVTVYGADWREGRFGVWMEHIRGRTLEALLRDNGPMTVREATLIGLDLCDAVAAVHRSGLLHRDINTKNVMREPSGRIVLMDFGLSQEIRMENRQESRSRAICGTPVYMAPELLWNSKATVRSDIYSIGVLLYHLVTGSYPVEERSLAGMRKAHAGGKVKLLREQRAGLPEPFLRTVELALAADLGERFATVEQIFQALNDSLDPDPRKE